MKVILCFSGGGMLGLQSAYIVKEIEKKLGKKLINSVDFVAGTSIGSILASLLNTGSNGTDCVNLFKNYGKKIFKKRFFGYLGIFKPRYSKNGIESVLKTVFNEKELKSGKVPILIPSYILNTKQPYFFKSYEKETENISFFDAARSSSAAPSFFPAHLIDNNLFWDGGVSQNNPSLCAFADARKLFGKHENFYVISIGCGKQKSKIDKYMSYLNCGIVKNLIGLFNALFVSSAEDVDYIMKELIGSNYINLNCETDKLVELDGVSDVDFFNLQENACQMIKTLEKDIEHAVGILKRNDKNYVECM